MSRITIAATHSVPGLEDLVPEWWDLWRRCPDATPFQSPAWLVPWIREFACDRFLVLAARRDDTLLGLLPVCLTGETAQLCGGRITDYLDAIVDPAAAREVAGGLLDELCSARLDVAKIELGKLRPGSALLEIAPRQGWTEAPPPDADPRPVLRLPGNGRSLDEALPKRMVQQLRYYRRRAARVGPVEARCAARDEAGGYFEQVAALHGARWAVRGADGVLSDDAVLRFHRAAVPRLADADLLRIFVLCLSGEPVAALYGFRRSDRFYYYIGGFDPARRRLAVGTLLIGHVIEETAREGGSAFDFLSGGEAYKYRWGAEDEFVHHRRLVRL